MRVRIGLTCVIGNIRPASYRCRSNGPTTRRFVESCPDYCKAGLVLDQASEGACTGFGLACVINYLHWRNSLRTAHDASVRRPSVPACSITSRASTMNGPVRTTTARAAAARSRPGTSTACAASGIGRIVTSRTKFVRAAESWLGGGRVAAPTGRVLPRESRISRRHAGGDQGDRRDLRILGRP